MQERLWLRQHLERQPGRHAVFHLPDAWAVAYQSKVKPFIPTAATDPQEAVTQPVHHLAPLKLQLVDHSTPGLWNEFIDRYHYPGYKPLAGAQMRYMVTSNDRLLAWTEKGARRMAIGLHGMEYQADVRPEGRMR